MAAAPAPSAMVFSRSSRSRTALAISSSSTVTISSTYFWTKGKSAVARPADGDAVGDGRGRRQGDRFAFRHRDLHRREPGGLHADDPDFRVGLLDGTGDAADQPPPPMGTTTASISGCCCSISSPRVPCPAMTASSSKGWTKVRCCCWLAPDGFFAGFVVVGAEQDDFGAV